MRTGVVELDSERGVQDVGRGEPLMNPTSGWTNGRCHILKKGDNVVIRTALVFGDLRDGKSGSLTNGTGILGGNLTAGSQLLASENLDLEPDFELALLGPELAHFRKRISINHNTGENPRTLRLFEKH